MEPGQEFWVRGMMAKVFEFQVNPTLPPMFLKLAPKHQIPENSSA
jgi:hypothetical protein